KQPMPPRWALGNFSSRFGYHSEAETRATIQKFKEDEIPVDAVILDIYWFGKDIQGHMGDFEFLRDSFPTPKRMIKDFRDQNIKTILITEPFVLTSSKRWQEAVDEKALAVDSTGNPAVYDFYFGNTGIIDVYSETGKSWFWNIYKEIADMGVAGVWGDLGEPEAHPPYVIHATGTADEVHNTYGHDWAKLVYEGYRKDFPEQRPFILMRAGYSGSQRYGLIPWSGDVSRSWGGLYPQTEIALQMAMQGMGYFHSDLGGFGGANLDDELYTRWLQYGVFLPIFRPHAQEQVPSEPVYREPKTKALAKKSIELRYRMLPYNYDLAFKNNREGVPLMRPLFFEEPENPNLLTYASGYMWGDSFLVTPVIEQGAAEQMVYLPKGHNWFDFYSEEKYAGGQMITVPTVEDAIPTFVKGGAFLALAKPVMSTEEYNLEAFDLHFYYDPSKQHSVASLYHDDGKTVNAFEKGRYDYLEFEAEVGPQKISITFNNSHGKNSDPLNAEIDLIILNVDNAPEKVFIDSKESEFFFDKEGRSVQIPFRWKSHRKLELLIKTQ
ncbi:MAG: DUF5110 domain-containing protein, partial [Bacteroidia bacterium]|nr:DUF5110 domain-containing protein [Bacteroidia bacterium]